MELSLRWAEPIGLIDGDEVNLTYKVEDFTAIPESSGVYIFARRYGDNINPLYVGKALNLRQRIKLQFNNAQLMNSILKSKQGERLLLVGEFEAKGGQEKAKSIGIIESALIEHCLSFGYDLFNKQGTKRPVHNISFNGNQGGIRLTGKLMKSRKTS